MDKSKKFSLPELVWYIFSLVVGISYIGTLTICNSTTDKADGGLGIGLNIIWIFALEGGIVAICAYAFAKLSSITSAKKNGGAYVYARTAFGRLTGYLVAFLQYFIMPFVITFQIMMLMKGFFEAPYVPSDSILNIGYKLGPFHSLILDLIGMLIYSICAIVIFFGIKWYKKLSTTMGIIKWVTAGLLILLGIVLMFMHGKKNYSDWYKHTHLSFSGFLGTFTAAFFYFTGFEQVITSTRNIHNPKKNVGKGLLIAMAIITALYVIVTTIFLGAVTAGNFKQNMMIGIWSQTGLRVLTIVGTIVMLLSQLALKAQISMINCLVGGTMLQPLSDEGYISDKFRKLNKENIPVRSCMLNIVLAGVVVFIWLIVPDIINGIMNSTNPNYNPKTALDPVSFNINQMTSVTSVITIFVYSIVILANFKFRKELKLKIWEMSAFGGALLVLGVNFIYHYYSLIKPLLHVTNFTTDALPSVIEFVFTLFIFLTVSLNYVFYYLPKYKTRLVEKPEIQKELDSHFVIASVKTNEAPEFNNVIKENIASQ